jgi:hypothetical protein
MLEEVGVAEDPDAGDCPPFGCGAREGRGVCQKGVGCLCALGWAGEACDAALNAAAVAALVVRRRQQGVE